MHTLSAQAIAYHRIGSSGRTSDSAECDGGAVSSVAQRRALLRAEQTMRLFCLPFRTHMASSAAGSAAGASSAGTSSSPIAATVSVSASTSASAQLNGAGGSINADEEVWI